MRSHRYAPTDLEHPNHSLCFLNGILIRFNSHELTFLVCIDTTTDIQLNFIYCFSDFMNTVSLSTARVAAPRSVTCLCMHLHHWPWIYFTLKLWLHQLVNTESDGDMVGHNKVIKHDPQWIDFLSRESILHRMSRRQGLHAACTIDWVCPSRV